MQEKAIGVVGLQIRTDSCLSSTGGNKHVHKRPLSLQNTGSGPGTKRKGNELRWRRMVKAIRRKITEAEVYPM